MQRSGSLTLFLKNTAENTECIHFLLLVDKTFLKTLKNLFWVPQKSNENTLFASYNNRGLL